MNPREFCLVVILYVLVGCQQSPPESAAVATPADIIITGDHIITLDPDLPTVTAVAISGQEIVAAGSPDEVMHLKSESTRVIELNDQALIPGFIDAHGHMTFVARLIELIDLASPPVGSVKNIDDIVE